MSKSLTGKDTRFINTMDEVGNLVDWIALQDTWMGDVQPPLYVDIEGEQLSRDGSVSLLTVLVYPGNGLERAHIIDIHELGAAVFHKVGRQGKSLKDIFESPKFLKVFFDVRNDSDALYSHYSIKLSGVRDVQLMESASRRTTSSRKFLSSLSKCIEEALIWTERDQWKLCKDKGEKLWNPNKGGSYSIFNIRPLSDDVIAYCVGDVKCLPVLYHKYNIGTVRWRNMVAEESQNRVTASQASGYQPRGPGRALSPWSSEQNRLLDSWEEVNPQKDYFAAFHNDSRDFDEYWDSRDDNDFEDWTRAPWQGPPS